MSRITRKAGTREDGGCAAKRNNNGDRERRGHMHRSGVVGEQNPAASEGCQQLPERRPSCEDAQGRGRGLQLFRKFPREGDIPQPSEDGDTAIELLPDEIGRAHV